MELPEVDLTPQGLEELLAPVALYPDPVLAIMALSAEGKGASGLR
jgi:hypothetical protein